MAKKDYKKLSDDIIAACGGVANVLSASHCMTRLRMNLRDASKLNVEEAKKIPGVLNIVVQNGEQQFVIGQDVASLYEEIIKNDIAAAGSVDDPEALKADALRKPFSLTSAVPSHRSFRSSSPVVLLVQSSLYYRHSVDLMLQAVQSSYYLRSSRQCCTSYRSISDSRLLHV